MPNEPRSTDRLIGLLESVNATAINNDVERGCGVGDHIAELCRQAAQRLRELEYAHKERMEQVGEFLTSNGYGDDSYLDRHARTEEFGSDEILDQNNEGC